MRSSDRGIVCWLKTLIVIKYRTEMPHGPARGGPTQDEDWLPIDLAESRSSGGTLLKDLWAGTVPYAFFPGFLDESECSAVVKALERAPMNTFKSGDAYVSTLGVYLPDSVDDPDAYFANAAELEPAIASVLKLDGATCATGSVSCSSHT